MSTEEGVMVLDADYIRSVGNEVYTQLFPRPRTDHPQIQPLPLPIAVNYRPADGIEFEVLFTPERIIKRITDEEVPDVPASRVRVDVENQATFTTDLEFGKLPTVTSVLDDPQETTALDALLHAVTGVLE